MATWTKDPATGERTLLTPATAPKARCCVEVAEVKAKTSKKAFIPESDPITETVKETESLLNEIPDQPA
jgi:hypothetical protein